MCAYVSLLPIQKFPFLFGGTFIEAVITCTQRRSLRDFPSFSEGLSLRLLRLRAGTHRDPYFPSFSEGLSLRLRIDLNHEGDGFEISLPFRRDFH